MFRVDFFLDWLISLQSKGLSRVFSSTTVQKHQFFTASLLHGPTLTSVHDYWKNHPSPFSEMKTGPRRAQNGQKPHGRAGRAGPGLPHLLRLTGPPQLQALAAKPQAALICLVSCPQRECFVHSRYSYICVKWMKVKQQIIWEFQRYFFSYKVSSQTTY